MNKRPDNFGQFDYLFEGMIKYFVLSFLHSNFE